MAEKAGVKELKEALSFVMAAVDAGCKISGDGKVDMSDLQYLLALIPKIEPAFSGLSEVPSELSDLSTEEAAELVAFIMAGLVIDDAKAKDVVEKGLKVLVAGYELVKAVKV